MNLFRVLFQDSDSEEYYQRWFVNKQQADVDAEKLVDDKITERVWIDTVDLPTVGGRFTLYNVAALLNKHALVATLNQRDVK